MRFDIKPAARGLIALLALGALSACGGHDEKKGAEKAAPAAGQAVSTAVIGAVAMPRTITASGTVLPWEDVPVAAETGGLTAVGVYVEEGRYVRQGQVLVQMNDALLRAQLRQQDASVTSARATLAQAEAALARSRELKERGFLSQASLDNALAAQATAAAGVAQAQAARGETATRLAQTTIRAPVSGLISRRTVTRGQIVQAGTELFRLVRDGRLELNAQIPETELGLIRSGMAATVTSNEVGTAAGTVRLVTPQVDPQSRLGLARIAISGGGFRPGMFARASIDVGSQPALIAPVQAVVYREGKPGVYALRPNSTVHFQQVVTGSRTQAGLEIVSGVTAGQRVVVQGAGFLGEGDRVNARSAAAPAQTAPAGTR